MMIIFPLTTGAPYVFDCIIPKGFPSCCCLYCFSNDNATAHPKE